MSDQDIIFPKTINAISSGLVMRIMKKKIKLGDYYLLQYQILQSNGEV